uniref:C2H2-type domain-containing protein n=1 Tax=Pristionchus pacificus TaxID=54126 RepID=A0A8R1YE37_PRIPA
MNSGFTCIACRMIFSSNDMQKAHYVSDWHRYNLKRHTVGMPPISLEEYDTKVAVFKTVPEPESSSHFCTPCSKSFSSQNTYDNHCKSKKHVEELNRTKKKGPHQPRKKKTAGSVVGETKEEEKEEKMEVEDNEEGKEETPKEEEEEVDSDSESWHTDYGSDEEGDEDINLNETEALPISSCLFCHKESSSLESSLDHMKTRHDFVIPDRQFCIDKEGLMEYLCLKVGAGRMCVFCPERRAGFPTIDAVQQHMVAKQHCRIDRSAEAMIELADYYDYEALYEDIESKTSGNSDDDGWTLVLPSGAKIGHRSLLRFYRQHLKGVDYDGKKGRLAIEKAKGVYSALAWTGCTGVAAHRVAKDLHFVARVRRRFELRVGVRSNKLFKSQGRYGDN